MNLTKSLAYLELPTEPKLSYSDNNFSNRSHMMKYEEGVIPMASDRDDR